MKYFMHLAYLGTDFCGLQYQPDHRTVQGELNCAFEALFGVTCRVTACSRTDSGVHALAAALTVALPDGTIPIPKDKLALAVQPYLPRDISVFDVDTREDTFHVRYDVVEKEYVYRISNRAVHDPFLTDRAWFYPRTLSQDAIARMQEAAAHLVGEHDFSAFQAQGSKASTSVRRLTACTVTKQDDEIRVTVRADGFLYNMVRIIVGTLVEVGVGRIAPDAIPAILAGRDRAAAGMTAPPEGLYLARVFYA